MVCRECEKSIARNSNYCKYCGARVQRVVPEIPKTTAEEEKKASGNLIYKVIEVTKAEADEGAERVLDFAGAVEPLHIIFPKLVCTGQLFMVKKFRFMNDEGKKYKKNILIKVNIA